MSWSCPDHSALVLFDVFRGQCAYELKLSPDHSALVLFDIFRGQCTYELKLP